MTVPSTNADAGSRCSDAEPSGTSMTAATRPNDSLSRDSAEAERQEREFMRLVFAETGGIPLRPVALRLTTEGAMRRKDNASSAETQQFRLTARVRAPQADPR